LFAAARAENVDEIITPAMARGAVVISDRFVDSSLAYQGVMRGLGVCAVLDLNLLATGGLLPDLTLLLTVDVDEAARRRLKDDRVEPSDRNERLEIDAAYRSLAKRFPQRIVEVDAGRAAAVVFEDIKAHVCTALSERGIELVQ
jgi:dTMP kinase